MVLHVLLFSSFMPMHPSNTYTIHELQENAADILHAVQEQANKQLKKVKMDLSSKLRDGAIWVDQGEIAGCSGGTFDNIVAAADILRGKSCGNGAFSLSVYPGSMPAYAALICPSPGLEPSRFGKLRVVWRMENSPFAGVSPAPKQGPQKHSRITAPAETRSKARPFFSRAE